VLTEFAKELAACVQVKCCEPAPLADELPSPAAPPHQ
jgi:hypothetical protein